MRIAEISGKYPVLKPVIEVLEEEGIDELFPPQAEAIESGFLDGKNLLLCCGTGSGKTLIAELAALKIWLETGKKVVYVVPLRALAMEKFEDFKKYKSLGLSVALSIGDYDSKGESLIRADVIVCTFEKLDSLIRHQAPWLPDVGLAILDEIHEMGSDRGPTLEMVTLWLREYGVQFLGLSATIGNAGEIAHWLDAELVESDFRPVPLHEGTYWNGIIEFANSEKGSVELAGGELALIEDELKKEKQALTFVNTRREAETLARKAQSLTTRYVEKEKLVKLSQRVIHTLDHPTEQCKKLAECVSEGSAFHHAGLLNEQRKLVEDAFKDGLIKFIAATVTLVAGVNLPAHRIIIRNVRRYNEEWPVFTYKQAVGRAGRIKYDKEGEAVVICRTPHEQKFVTDNYIFGKAEDCLSRLGAEPILRMHLLGAIANERFTRDGLKKFFFKSFYSHQFKDNTEFSSRLDRLVEQLKKWKFVHESDYLNTTPLGKRISELYIDPATGHFFVDQLNATADEKKDRTFGFIQMISQALENEPLPSINRTDAENIQTILEGHMDELLTLSPLQGDPEYEDYIRSGKLTCILNDWIDEKTENHVLTTYRLAPGGLRTRISVAEWLAYSAREISDILGYKQKAAHLRILESRIHHGIRPELIPLTSIRGIGRVRGRRLWNSGIKSRKDIIKNPEKASQLIGRTLVQRIVAHQSIGPSLERSTDH